MAVDKLVDSTQLDADLTSVANAIRTKGGTSAQLAFPAGFVSAIGAIPTGGGSPLIASGTFTGNGDYRITVPIADKVPIKNFAFLAEYASASVASDANYKIIKYAYIYDGDAGFTKNGSNYYPQTGRTFSVGSTDLSYLGFYGEVIYIRNTTIDGYRGAFTGTGRQFRKGSGVIDFYIDVGNGNYKFVSGETYNWKLIYFGSNYDNESLTYSGF